MRALAGFPVDAASAPAMESILSPETLLARPRTLVSLHLLGLDASKALSATGQIAAYTVDAQADVVTSAEAVLTLGQRAPVAHAPLDQDVFNGCDAACMDAALVTVLASIDATLDARTVTLANGAELSLDNALHRAFLQDLAAVARGFALAMERPAPGAGDRPELLEGVIASLQALRTAYGVESPIFQGAAEAMTVVTARGLEGLSGARGADMAALIVSTGDVVEGAKPQEVMLWRGSLVAKRRLQAQAAAQDSAPLSRYDWANRFGMAITLIFFLVAALAGIYAMVYMPFAADALLFPTKEF